MKLPSSSPNLLVQLLLLLVSAVSGGESFAFATTAFFHHHDASSSLVASTQTQSASGRTRLSRVFESSSSADHVAVDESTTTTNDVGIDSVPSTTVSFSNAPPPASTVTTTSKMKMVTSDLKALLPKQKMRFMKLDKFGRRIQRMEDDGTVNMKKEPRRSNLEAVYPGEHDDDDDVAAATPFRSPNLAGGTSRVAFQSPSLASFLGTTKSDRDNTEKGTTSGTAGGRGIDSVDLKGLLPKQKMKFLKLDKFGRRIQRMEDDGTVNMMKEPAAQPPPIAAPPDTPISVSGLDRGGDSTLVDAIAPVATTATNYGSLKNLLPSKRITWTKLDFKGASIEDERRMKKTAVVEAASRDNVGGVGIEIDDRQGGGLKELLPVRPTWTRLDFRGASVEDERRTRRNSSQTGKKFNEGQYSNLKTLLPARTINFRKGQVFSSGSATIVNSNMRTQSLGSQGGVMNESTTVDAVSDHHRGDEFDGVINDTVEDSGNHSSQGKSFTNLKDLLPERRLSWRTIK